MTARRSLIIPLLIVLGLTAAGCGSDSKDKAETTTTAKASSASTTAAGDDGAATDSTAPEEATTTTVADSGKFQSGLATMKSSLDAAGNDFCKITTAVSSFTQAGDPENADDVKAFLAFYTDFFDKLAANLPADSGIDPDVLTTAAKKLADDAEKGGYSTEMFSSSAPPDAFAGKDITEAMSKLGGIIAKSCTDTTPTTTPGA